MVLLLRPLDLDLNGNVKINMHILILILMFYEFTGYFHSFALLNLFNIIFFYIQVVICVIGRCGY